MARASRRAQLVGAIQALAAARAPRRVAQARELARSLAIPIDEGA